MVRAGLAWMYRRDKDDQGLSDVEAEAQAAKRGLWAGRDRIPPGSGKS
ncbi:MAG: thermonuclease family protein [Nitrospiraceae bacterium]